MVPLFQFRNLCLIYFSQIKVFRRLITEFVIFSTVKSGEKFCSKSLLKRYAFWQPNYLYLNFYDCKIFITYYCLYMFKYTTKTKESFLRLNCELFVENVNDRRNPNHLHFERIICYNQVIFCNAFQSIFKLVI